MKIFLENYNGVLDLLEDSLEDSGELTDNPHEADCFVLWQDVRGVCQNLAMLAKQVGKPVVVMQHGRGAVRDYGPPNNFKLIADKIMVWGEAERRRLLSYGISNDRIALVGCPLFSCLKERPKDRPGKNILFVPVIAQKEEPENLLVYATLKKWETEKLIENIYEKFPDMKKAWAWEETNLREVTLPDGTKEKRVWNKEVRHNLPRWVTYEKGLVNVKLSGVHDAFQYQAPLIATGQNDPMLVDGLAALLGNIDAMVCLEEGTMQLMAHAMGIPVIVVDIFNYQNYGGCKDYDRIEKIHTKACYWTNKIEKVGRLLDQALANPKELQKHRETVVQDEGSPEEDSLANAISCIKSCIERKEAVTVG